MLFHQTPYASGHAGCARATRVQQNESATKIAVQQVTLRKLLCLRRSYSEVRISFSPFTKDPIGSLTSDMEKVCDQVTGESCPKWYI